MAVITRRGVVGPCKCGVGHCRVCHSSCCRCKCGCDGINPRDAIERGHGQQEGHTKSKQLRQEELLVSDLHRSNQSKQNKVVVVVDNDSTWNPPVVKKKVAQKKSFKTITNLNTYVSKSNSKQKKENC